MLTPRRCVTCCWHPAHVGKITIRYRCCTCFTKLRRPRRGPLANKHADGTQIRARQGCLKLDPEV